MHTQSPPGVLAVALIALASIGSAAHAQNAVIQPTFGLEPSIEDLPTYPPPASLHFGSAVAVHRNTAMVSIPGLDP
ncbi:MAG: hypothetical protein ABW110_13890, partial [Steroidobacteraceae bacterium]